MARRLHRVRRCARHSRRYASTAAVGAQPNARDAGGNIATAWASVVTLSERGFLEKTKDRERCAASPAATRRRHPWRTVMDTSTYLQNEIAATPGVQLCGRPHCSVIAFMSADPALNIYCVADRLEEIGW
jgi:hypothetical protein